MKNEKYDKYKYENVQTLVKEIEDDIYNFSVKLQPFTKSPSLHYTITKFALSRGKTTIALKSLLYLHNYHNSTHEYADSLRETSNYINANKDKISQFSLDLIYEKVEILKAPEALEKYLSDKNCNIGNIDTSYEKWMERLLTEVKETVTSLKLVVPSKELLKLSHHDLRAIKSEV